MRSFDRFAAAACLAAAIVPLTAGAADPALDLRSYVAFRFGGDTSATGLRLGLAATDGTLHDALPPLALVEFSARGLQPAVAGLPLTRAPIKLSQAEDEVLAEDGLFDSGALLGVGAAALGAGALYGIFVLAEEDEDDPATPGAPPQSSTCPLPLPDPAGLCPTIVDVVETVADELPAPPAGPALTGAARQSWLVARDPEREQWLDSGTGQMGDLIAR